MSDQQQCPECREEFAGPIEKTAHRCPGRKSSPEKLAAPNPGQDNLVVPDSVIEQAAEVGREATQVVMGDGFRSTVLDPDLIVSSAAPVIAAWARAEERERIIRAIEETFAESQRCPETNWMLALWDRYSDGDPLPEVLAALDRDGSADTREGNQ